MLLNEWLDLLVHKASRTAERMKAKFSITVSILCYMTLASHFSHIDPAKDKNSSFTFYLTKNSSEWNLTGVRKTFGKHGVSAFRLVQ